MMKHLPDFIAAAASSNRPKFGNLKSSDFPYRFGKRPVNDEKQIRNSHIRLIMSMKSVGILYKIVSSIVCIERNNYIKLRSYITGTFFVPIFGKHDLILTFCDCPAELARLSLTLIFVSSGKALRTWKTQSEAQLRTAAALRRKKVRIPAYIGRHSVAAPRI